MLAIEKPDIVKVIESEGIELRQKGRNYWAGCPFHSERTSSFCVNSERQRFKCFGCQMSGDVIDFIQKHRGLSFKDALRYLGILINDRQHKTNYHDNRKRRAIERFKRWEQLYRRALCELIRLAHRINQQVKTPEDLEILGVSEMYQKRYLYELHLDILNNSDDESKYLLFKEVVYGR